MCFNARPVTLEGIVPTAGKSNSCHIYHITVTMTSKVSNGCSGGATLNFLPAAAMQMYVFLYIYISSSLVACTIPTCSPDVESLLEDARDVHYGVSDVHSNHHGDM